VSNDNPCCAGGGATCNHENTENRIRFFSELTDEEGDRAVGIVRQQLAEDYDNGKIDLLFGWNSEEELQDYLWDIASGIVEHAVFIPDDGTYVVRL
jgi:hypothetical protein